MSASKSQVDDLLEHGSANPKRIFVALNEEPTTPDNNKSISPEQATALIRQHYEVLSGEEVDAVLNFLKSDAGSKQRSLAEAFSKSVREHLSSNESADVSPPAHRTAKVQAFFDASGAAAAGRLIPQSSATNERHRVDAFAIRFYADNLTDDELDELIHYYRSTNGKVAVEAATKLSAAIIKQYGL